MGPERVKWRALCDKLINLDLFYIRAVQIASTQIGKARVPTLNILMCTYNGGAYLEPQLQSLLAQDHADWRLWSSDDGSEDDTVSQLTGFAAAHPDRVMPPLTGPGRGAAAHFLSLLARPEMAGQWVAFADQDDVWLPHKLARAVDQLGQEGAIGPAVYASRSLHTDAQGAVLGPSPRHARALGFGNALVQNVLAGNTLVLTPGATDLLRATLDAAQDVPFHDWWVYLVATGAGIPVINDAEPGVLYRQHRGNLLGAGGRQRMGRAALLWNGTYARWIDANIAALSGIAGHLTPEAAALTETVRGWRTQSGRRVSPQALGLYRQSANGDRILRTLARLRRL